MQQPGKRQRNIIIQNIYGQILRRVLRRVFSLPAYAFVAAPWLLVLFEKTKTEHQAVRNSLYEIIRYLAGQPHGAVLDETDIAKAVALLFLAMNIVIEVANYLLKRTPKDHVKTYMKRELIVRIAISSVGWLAAAWALYPDLGIKSVFVCVLFMVLMPVFCAMDFFVYWTMQYIKKQAAAYASQPKK